MVVVLPIIGHDTSIDCVLMSLFIGLCDICIGLIYLFLCGLFASDLPSALWEPGRDPDDAVASIVGICGSLLTATLAMAAAAYLVLERPAARAFRYAVLVVGVILGVLALYSIVDMPSSRSSLLMLPPLALLASYVLIARRY
jgi:hypothetical protein